MSRSSPAAASSSILCAACSTLRHVDIQLPTQCSTCGHVAVLHQYVITPLIIPAISADFYRHTVIPNCHRLVQLAREHDQHTTTSNSVPSSASSSYFALNRTKEYAARCGEVTASLPPFSYRCINEHTLGAGLAVSMLRPLIDHFGCSLHDASQKSPSIYHHFFMLYLTARYHHLLQTDGFDHTEWPLLTFILQHGVPFTIGHTTCNPPLTNGQLRNILDVIMDHPQVEPILEWCCSMGCEPTAPDPPAVDSAWRAALTVGSPVAAQPSSSSSSSWLEAIVVQVRTDNHAYDHDHDHDHGDDQLLIKFESSSDGDADVTPQYEPEWMDRMSIRIASRVNAAATATSDNTPMKRALRMDHHATLIAQQRLQHSGNDAPLLLPSYPQPLQSYARAMSHGYDQWIKKHQQWMTLVNDTTRLLAPLIQLVYEYHSHIIYHQHRKQ